MIEIELGHWGEVRPSVVFLILRSSGREDDQGLDRQRRIEEYLRLAAVERNDYPVRQIHNDGSQSLALRQILQEVPFARCRSVRSGGSGKKLNAFQAQLLLEAPVKSSSGPEIFTRLAPAKTTLVYESYWAFATERQKIFFSRAKGEAPPWTGDQVLRDFKFTNAYRASDRVSQYLIKHVIYRGSQTPEEVFFRTIIFKIFNRIDTWEMLEREFGEVTYRDYSFRRYNVVFTAAMGRGERIYSPAYIMPSGGRAAPDGRKHSMHLRLVERMVRDGLPSKIAGARSMAQAFDLLRSYPTIGDFLAYQYVTDLNYGPLTSFTEMEFVVPGPGALSGIRKCFSDFGGLTEAEIIKVVTDRQEEEFRSRDLPFQSLWGRPLQLIDCQNLFCEVDKYARVKHPEFNGPSGRTRIKQRFSAATQPIEFWYPPKWEINKRIAKWKGSDV